MTAAIPGLLLAAVLAFAVARPRGWPEAAVAVPAAVAEPLGVDPAWVATAGALVLAVRQVAAAGLRAAGPVLAATQPLFCAFVLALAVVVAAVRAHGLGDLLSARFPTQAGVAGLLGAAVIAAVLANLCNNLPATLLFLPSSPHTRPWCSPSCSA